jgi:putative transposase
MVMARYRRAVVAGGSYFFTVVIELRQPILTDPPMRSALREAITLVRKDYPFVINGWVLLPDHLHTIWTLPEGDADYSTRWRLIKTRVTKSCGNLYARPQFSTARRTKKRCGTLWQHRYWEHFLRDETDFTHHMDYLHMNPIKHGLVKQARDWPFSSFHRLVKLGLYPIDWAVHNL